VSIAETLANYARITRDPEVLTEFVRQALSRQISAQFQDEAGRMHVVTLSPRLEQTLSAGLQQTDQGSNIVLEPGLAHRIIQATGREAERLANSGHHGIVLASSRIRRPFRKLIERMLPSVIVLSYSEIAQSVDVQSLGMVEVTGED
jgi:flagellar biosynthesis protein FlhA